MICTPWSLSIFKTTCPNKNTNTPVHRPIRVVLFLSLLWCIYWHHDERLVNHENLISSLAGNKPPSILGKSSKVLSFSFCIYLLPSPHNTICKFIPRYVGWSPFKYHPCLEVFWCYFHCHQRASQEMNSEDTNLMVNSSPPAAHQACLSLPAR